LDPVAFELAQYNKSMSLLIRWPVATLPFLKSGKLKAIAISGERRLPSLPKLPTFSAAGLPGIDITVWNGLLAPAGTPRDIVDKLSAETGRIMTAPEMVERLDAQGLVGTTSTPEQFAALMKTDLAKFGRIIKSAKIKID
jgi:tripartite-type tricarboxylate transporter receptor subunit TctC